MVEPSNEQRLTELEAWQKDVLSRAEREKEKASQARAAKLTRELERDYPAVKLLRQGKL